MFSYSRVVSIAVTLTLLLPLQTLSESQQVSTTPELIMLTVTVKNRAGEYVMGLDRNAFHLIDEKEVRPIEFLESSDNPLSLGILIDTSGSMIFHDLKEFAQAQSLGKAMSGVVGPSHNDNEYFLMAFAGNPLLNTDWMSGKTLLDLKPELKKKKSGETALYDVCLAAVAKLTTGRHSKKAMVLVSDGIDNASKHSLKDVKNVLKNSNVIVYGILVRNLRDLSDQPIEGERVMNELTNTGGGETLIARNKRELEQSVEMIAVQLRHQYQIGFKSAGGPPNKWHRVNVRVSIPSMGHPEFDRLSIQTRQGYYSR